MILEQEKKEKLFFDPEMKNKFLNAYIDSTTHVYKQVFLKSKIVEEGKEKDLALFNPDEIADFIQDQLKPQSINSARTFGRVISAYLNWAFENGFRPRINPLSQAHYSYFDRFVDQSIQNYFSYDDVGDILQEVYNATDAVAISLIFDGVLGKQSSELRKLKQTDIVDESNCIIMIERNGKHIPFNVEKRTMRLIKKAISEPDYYKNNGKYMIEPQKGIAPAIRLLDNDYIIRNVFNGKKNVNIDSPVDHFTINRRLKQIQVFRHQLVTPMNIQKSGMIYEGYRLLKEYGKLDKEQYIMIANKFGKNVENWYTLKEYVNEEEIEKLYGEK